jgi:hypothetical protein
MITILMMSRCSYQFDTCRVEPQMNMAPNSKLVAIVKAMRLEIIAMNGRWRVNRRPTIAKVITGTGMVSA